VLNSSKNVVFFLVSTTGKTLKKDCRDSHDLSKMLCVSVITFTKGKESSPEAYAGPV